MHALDDVRRFSIALVVLLAVLSSASGKVIHVDDDAGGAGDGTSWPNARKYLQDALAQARSGDEIRVAQGLYRPDEMTAGPPSRRRRALSVSFGTGDRTATFGLRNGVTIRGGYAGLGTPDPDARDISEYATILSGDLRGDDRPGFANNTDNSYHVVTGNDTDRTAVLDGVTITGGNANDEDPDSDRTHGGGVYMDAGRATLTRCTIVANAAMQGGGMCALTGSGPTLADCVFLGNFAHYHGGAMDNSESNPSLTNCTFLANSVAMKYGAGIRNYRSSPHLVNCLFVGNTAEGNAAAMFNHNHSNPTLVNCTLSGNAAHGVAGIDNALESTPALTNCILWGNTSHVDTGEAAQIRGQTSSMHFCCIQGWSGTWAGTGNHGGDPLFVDADGADGVVGTLDDDLRLLPGSPCIDAGTNAALSRLVVVDLAGNPRIVNGMVDMGAYEGVAAPAPKVYHVDALTGNDGADGLSSRKAFATIQKGIETANDADTVLVYPGLYKGEVDFLGKAIMLQGVATKAGIPVLENPRGFAVSFYSGEGPGSVLANVVIRGSFIGIFVAGSSPTIRNITLVDNGSGVEAYVGSAPDITNCIFARNTDIDLFQCAARYSRLEQADATQHNISADPLFVDPNNGDYHLRSERGRYWAEHDVWVLDEVTSPCVDGGDPNAPVMQERMPNGGRINMGAYGGTPYASMSEVPCPCGQSGNQLPHVAIVAPLNGAMLNYANRVIVEVEANDIDGLIIKVELFVDGTQVGQDVDGTDGWTIEWTDHPSGDYVLVARATDDDGAFADSAPVQISLRSYSRSSRRYKVNVTDLEIDPDDVLKLRPVRFQWKTTGDEDIGLIAEDLAERLPDLVICDKAQQPDGVKYDRVALYLLTVVKAQQQRISALEASDEQSDVLLRRLEALERALPHAGKLGP